MSGLTGLIDSAKRILRTTQIEIALVGLLGAAVGGYASLSYEVNRANRIPLSFSEITQIDKEADEKEIMVGPMTRFLTSVNDSSMKVFESWNNANERGDCKTSFALELQEHMRPVEQQYHHTLDDFLTSLPAESDKVLDQLSEFSKVRAKTRPIVALFNEAWDYSRDDHYHTEYYTEEETYTDSNNRTQTRTVTKSREVYDNSTHYYTYHQDKGEAAALGLDDLIGAHRSVEKPIEIQGLDFSERLLTSTKVHAENRHAIDHSWRPDPKKPFEDGDYLRIASIWFTGATIVNNLPTVQGRWNGLPALREKWMSDKQTAHSETYTTGSMSDPGPKEYQTALRAHDHTEELFQKIDQIVGGVEYVRANATPLRSKINEYISVVKKEQPGNTKLMSKDIMDTARSFYRMNFKEGIDVDRFRWGMVALFAFLGAIAGAGAGFGLDYLGDKYEWFGEEEWKRRQREWNGYR